LQETEQLVAEDELPDAAEIVTEPAPEMLTGIVTFGAAVTTMDVSEFRVIEQVDSDAEQPETPQLSR
jgi:hypothetical protein